MRPAEVLALIAYYQGSVRQTQPMPKSTEAIWVRVLEEVGELRDAQAALDDMLARDEFVTPQRIVLGARVERNRRWEDERTAQPALPGPEMLVEQAPEDVKAILAKYWEGVGKGRRGSAIVKATANIDPDARVEAGRLAAQAAIEREASPAEIAKLRAEKLPKEPKLKPGDVCDGVGKPAIMLNGVKCCPVCQSPVEQYRKVWVRDDSKKGGHYETWQEGGCVPSRTTA